jgi:hypothetical protein
LASIGELQSRYVSDVLGLTRALQGYTRDVVVQAPTLPIDPVYPKKLQIASLVGLAATFAVLLWVFARRSWLALAAQPRSADKMARLRAATKLQ